MDEPNLDWTGVVADRLIKEAMEAGEFENLPGQGQPLSEDALSTPAYQRFATRALKEAKVLPEWLELEKEIAREYVLLAPTRQRLLRALRAATNEPSRARLADRLRSLHRDRVRVLNTLVLKYNMYVPVSVQRSFQSFNVSQEMQEIEEEIAAARRDAELNQTNVSSSRRRR